jgi:hypothetical protein
LRWTAVAPGLVRRTSVCSKNKSGSDEGKERQEAKHFDESNRWVSEKRSGDAWNRTWTRSI